MMTSEEPGERPEPLLDFTRLGRRLRASAGLLAVLAVVAALVEVARGGMVGVAAVRWVTAAVAAVLIVAAVLVALQAYRAADVVQRRGERLGSDDVGLGPSARRREGR